MKNKIIMLLIIVLITGCNKENKITCVRTEEYTRYYVEHIIEPDKEIGDNPNEVGANIVNKREYYLKSNGIGVKRIIETLEINFIIDTDMTKQLIYYNSGCDNINDQYKTCKVNQNGNTITIIAELNLNSTDYKEIVKSLTKDEILDSSVDENGKCVEN